MTTALATNAGGNGTVSNIVVSAPRPAHRSGFHELLSELNPLQYIPVVGTIYRALTGDKIPDEARTVGSLVVSGLTGGPVGVAISLAAMGVEKALGIDPEKLEQGVLAAIGNSSAKPVETTSTTPATASAAPQSGIAPSFKVSSPEIAQAALAAAWSPAQLAAYGVTTSALGALKSGGLEGSDVLNDLELARLAPATPKSHGAAPSARLASAAMAGSALQAYAIHP